MEARTARDSSAYNVRAIERAIDILECFDDEHPTRGVSEVAEVAGLPKATAHRIMTTLANHGFLERLNGGQEYRLGMRLVALGLQIIRRLDLPREALPYMRQVAEHFDETVDLSVYNRGAIICVQVVRSRRVLALATGVGQIFPAHATATGKVFLAHLPAEERERILGDKLTSYTPKTITSPDVLRAQLEEFRRLGYGCDDEEFELGVRAVAVPITNSRGEIMAVLSMPGPVARLTEDRYPEIAGKLAEAGRAIALHMGWQTA